MAVNLGEEGFASCGSDGLVVLWKVCEISPTPTPLRPVPVLAIDSL